MANEPGNTRTFMAKGFRSFVPGGMGTKAALVAVLLAGSAALSYSTHVKNEALRTGPTAAATFEERFDAVLPAPAFNERFDAAYPNRGKQSSAPVSDVLSRAAGVSASIAAPVTQYVGDRIQDRVDFVKDAAGFVKDGAFSVVAQNFEILSKVPYFQPVITFLQEGADQRLATLNSGVQMSATLAASVYDNNVQILTKLANYVSGTPALTAQQAASEQARRTEISDARLTTRDVLADQKALARIVEREANKYDVDDFQRFVMAYAGFVKDNQVAGRDASTDNLLGIDDGMWSWMMRNHAEKVGLGSYMEGVTVNDDASIDAVSAMKLGAMLELRNKPDAAVKVFTSWLAQEIGVFGDMGYRPSTGEMAVIAMTDSEGGMDAAHIAKTNPDMKLAPEIQIAPRTWKTKLFADKDGKWLSAKDAMASVSAKMAVKMASAYDRIPYDPFAAPEADDDYKTDDLRQNKDRFAAIVAEAVKTMPAATEAKLEKAFADGGIRQFATDVRDKDIGSVVMAMTATIDQTRFGDTAGGIYAMGEGQWLQAFAAYADPSTKESFMDGIEIKPDGSVHAANPDAIGALLRLREHGPIATQVVLAKTVDTISTLQKDLGRSPYSSEILVSHLFGVGAGEQFAKAADGERGFDQLRFSPGDPRSEWSARLTVGRNGITDVVALRDALNAADRFNGNDAKVLLQQHAESVPSHMRP